MSTQPYPIGTPGQPWGEEERRQWRASRQVRRSYAGDVLAEVDLLASAYDVASYGRLDYGERERFTLVALRSRDWDPGLPIALVSGGVHGYETSGVTGALGFAREAAGRYAGRANLLIAPCVSPWGYERIERWNALALDPNRHVTPDSPAPEAAAFWSLVAPLREHVLVHIDLHETTDSDESEFRPALAARDGMPFVPGTVPDGFYLVNAADDPRPAFYDAIIEAVSRVTHIAPADPDGTIIGCPVVAPGVIEFDTRALGLCAGSTPAPYVTTTEVYPDSPRASDAQCRDAQVAAATAAVDFALAQED